MLPASPPGKMPPPPPPYYGGPPPAYTEEQPTYPTTPVPEGYARRFTIWFSPKYLQYVAPVALFLVLVLTFFPWVGMWFGPMGGGQNAWQAAFGMIGADKEGGPGVAVLLIFYLLLFIPTFLITIGCLVLSLLPAHSVPPAIHVIMPWRWGIAAALNLVVFLFLCLQLVLRFPLENFFYAHPPGDFSGPEQALASLAVSRTIWLDFAVLFHILTIAGAGLTFWVLRRGPRPAPRLDLLT